MVGNNVVLESKELNTRGKWRAGLLGVWPVQTIAIEATIAVTKHTQK